MNDQSETEKVSIKFLSSEVELSTDSNKRSPQSIFLGQKETLEKLKPFDRFLNQLIDADNLLILAGSGTSLTFNVIDKDKIAPSMFDLWEICRNLDSHRFDLILNDIKYADAAPLWPDGSQKKDIELLLSMCDSYIDLKCLSMQRQTRINLFLKEAKEAILLYTDFTTQVPKELWESHDRFVRVLGRRSPKQKRLKIFTTNYDLAFEEAASNIGMIVIDGFEYSNPSRFNPAWFNYDIVNRTSATEKGGAYLPNVIHLYKLHGSVDWIRTRHGIQKRSFSKSISGDPVFIYPSSSKYQNSYDSPYLDMMAAFLDALQRPKTALLCLGFGFNDKHINNAISMALRTNPEFMIMAATKDLFDSNGSFNPLLRKEFTNAINVGDARIALVDCTFNAFSSLLPDRNKATPEEEFFKLFERASHGGEL